MTSGGRRRVTGGGTTVVLFDGPATAVRAAYAAAAGRSATIGVSIAEVPVEGLAASGLGVDLAVALADRGAVGEVLASAAVGLLLPASGIELAVTDDPATFAVASV